MKPTSSVVFNTANLALNDLSISSPALPSPEVHPASALKLDEEAERATLQLSKQLPVGSKAEFKIGFNGELTGAMLGYYHSAWEHEGKTQHYTLTQFEVSLRFHISCLETDS